jgi:DNA invertase Pin-like site-specific DNA recombinase
MLEMRMRTGLTYKAARGGYTGGPPPYGYRVERKELLVDPAEAKVVRYVFWMFKSYGMTQLAITAHLNENKERDVDPFNRQKVARILHAEALYKGVYKDCYGSTHRRPDLKILPDNEEELSDEFSK